MSKSKKSGSIVKGGKAPACAPPAPLSQARPPFGRGVRRGANWVCPICDARKAEWERRVAGHASLVANADERWPTARFGDMDDDFA